MGMKIVILLSLLVSTASSQGSVTFVGMGCADSNGRVAGLASADPPYPGNSQFTVTLTFASPGLSAYVFAALAPAAPPIQLGAGSSCILYLDPGSLLQLAAAGINPIGPLTVTGNGTALFPVPIPPVPALSGMHAYLQAAIVDPALGLGFSTTNALDVLFG